MTKIERQLLKNDLAILDALQKIANQSGVTLEQEDDSNFVAQAWVDTNALVLPQWEPPVDG